MTKKQNIYKACERIETNESIWSCAAIIAANRDIDNFSLTQELLEDYKNFYTDEFGDTLITISSFQENNLPSVTEETQNHRIMALLFFAEVVL